LFYLSVGYWSGRVSTSPPSRAGGSQPPRLAEREALIPRRGCGSQPPRRGGESQPPRQCGGSQPPRQGGGSQPPRQGGSFQPPRRGGGSQPPRQCGGSQPPHQGGGSQPPREGGGPYPPSKAELEGFNPPVKMEKINFFTKIIFCPFAVGYTINIYSNKARFQLDWPFILESNQICSCQGKIMQILPQALS